MNRILRIIPLILLFILLMITSCQTTAPNIAFVQSPSGSIEITFTLVDGVPYYQVDYAGKAVIRPSRLGFVFKDDPPLNHDLEIISIKKNAFDETWTQPWGEVAHIRNHYNEVRIELEENTPEPRRMTLVFRAYDDGLGFRYELPEQEHLHDFEIMQEETQFVLTGDHAAWWIPAYRDNRYEYLYNQTTISAFLKKSIRAVHTPLTMETVDGLYLSIHEASLIDFASMTLEGSENHTLLCNLVPWSDEVKVKGSTPMRTPWRTIQVAETPGDLITSYLILNLNEPNKLWDVSWVQPGKYIGIWWGMHIGQYTWESGELHGATTENTKRYIDFAAKHGFAGVLVEGWNIGWDGDWTRNGELFRFTKPYDDFDIQELSAYAASRGVRLIGHHETASAVMNYENQLEGAFAFYQDLGISIVKTGYVGSDKAIRRYDETGEVIGFERHHGQYMVRHYQYVVETAAKYGIMLDVHEPVKDTGLRRTYPNMMTREGARGQEYNAWSPDGGNPPEHTVILPFTRLLAGPMDFTPGIFDILIEQKPDNRVNTTLAKQLALYVVLYSPLQMAADLPEHYEGQPAFQFIVDVPVDWNETRVLHGQIGDFITVVRQDRNSQDWYLGSITDKEGRTLQARLDFLEPGVDYVAQVYADGEDADWQNNPFSLEIKEVIVNSETLLEINLAPGGGQAIRFRPATADDLAKLPVYAP